MNIYALREQNWIRYVGKTKGTLRDRLSGHLREARKGISQTYKSRAIRKLLENGITPRITLIKTVNGTGAKEERTWIAYFKSFGIKLWNLTEGGEGEVGWHHSKEARNRISERHRSRIIYDREEEQRYFQFLREKFHYDL